MMIQNAIGIMQTPIMFLEIGMWILIIWMVSIQSIGILMKY